MSRQMSFTKYERKILPDYRQRLSAAESVHDVRRFFVYMAGLLMKEIFADKLILTEGDMELTPDGDAPYRLGYRLSSHPEFRDAWDASDLSDVLARMAEMACNRCRHLEKQPERIPAKIRK